MDFLISFRHVQPSEIDSSSRGTISDDHSHPIHDGSIGDSCRGEPSLGQYPNERVFPSYFILKFLEFPGFNVTLALG